MTALTMLASEAPAAQPPVGLGTADSFAVLAGSTVTDTGSSTINGNLGLSPGTAVTGFSPSGVNGTTHAADAVAAQAQSDLTTAYNDAAGRTPALSVTSELGGLTLTPGVYQSASSMGLTGALTLDAQGDPDAVFIFKTASTLTTASASRVNLVNGAQPCNVYWQVGSSATLGTSSAFVGTILALTSISMNNGVTVQGRALARNGAVTLINDTISAARCATGGGTGDDTGGGGTGGGAPGGGGEGETTGARNGTTFLTTVPREIARTITRYGTGRCVDPTFRVTVSGLFIRRVVFSLDGRVIGTRSRSPFEALVRAGNGIHTVTARVTYTDGSRAARLRMRFRACGAARGTAGNPAPPSRPPRTPGGFTG